jgi:hypothetical protein
MPMITEMIVTMATVAAGEFHQDGGKLQTQAR